MRETAKRRTWVLEKNPLQASGKTKFSSARAQGRLLALRGVDGAELYDEESVPSEERIKRFFGTLSQKQKTSQRT